MVHHPTNDSTTDDMSRPCGIGSNRPLRGKICYGVGSTPPSNPCPRCVEEDAGLVPRFDARRRRIAVASVGGTGTSSATYGTVRRQTPSGTNTAGSTARLDSGAAVDHRPVGAGTASGGAPLPPHRTTATTVGRGTAATARRRTGWRSARRTASEGRVSESASSAAGGTLPHGRAGRRTVEGDGDDQGGAAGSGHL